MKKLYVVYKTHLDIGFTDLAQNVIDSYVEDFIPRAVQLGKERPETFVWTTGSWLMDYYLKLPTVTEDKKEALREALRAGTIQWHGLSTTTHCELMDKKLFDYGLTLSKNLDQQFNKETIAAKMTDIPGHTIGILPLMAKAGLKYLHIGVNASTVVPDIPEMFVWRGKDGSEMVVHYAEGWDEMLYFAHSHDNQGPPKSAEEIDEIISKIKETYPDTEVIPSGLDAFGAYAWSKKDTLPIVEEEIGDTWIHGVGTDPQKVGQLRQLYRLRDQWLADGEMTIDSQEYADFSDQLLMIVEHTWGGNGNVFLPDYHNYLIEDFKKAREKDIITVKTEGYLDYGGVLGMVAKNIHPGDLTSKHSYRLMEASWQEQREYIKQAIATLAPNRQAEVQAAFAANDEAIKPLVQKESLNVGYIYQLPNGIELSVGLNGGINYLKINDRELVVGGNEFGGLSYERFDEGDYQQFMNQYCRLSRHTATWALVDYNKGGIEAYPSIYHEVIKPMVEAGTIQMTGDQVEIAIDVVYKEFDVTNWGVPERNRLTYVIDTKEGTIDGTYRWEGKQANRMPEGYWLETSLKVNNPYRWEMNKLSYSVSPYDVVSRGNRNLHGLSFEGMTYLGSDAKLQITSETAPLVSMGRRGLLKFDQAKPSLNEGIFVNLYNNTWGTNFPDWFEDDMTFKFGATFEVY